MQGETRKIPPAAFVSFGAQKKHYSAAAGCSLSPPSEAESLPSAGGDLSLYDAVCFIP